MGGSKTICLKKKHESRLEQLQTINRQTEKKTEEEKWNEKYPSKCSWCSTNFQYLCMCVCVWKIPRPPIREKQNERPSSCRTTSSGRRSSEGAAGCACPPILNAFRYSPRQPPTRNPFRPRSSLASALRWVFFIYFIYYNFESSENIPKIHKTKHHLSIFPSIFRGIEKYVWKKWNRFSRESPHPIHDDIPHKQRFVYIIFIFWDRPAILVGNMPESQA